MTTETRDIPRRPRVIGSRAPTDLTADTWTIPQTRRALKLHLDGDFSRSALLADAMRGDERISADLRTRVMAVTGLPFRVDPSPAGDQRRAKMIAAELAAHPPPAHHGQLVASRELLEQTIRSQSCANCGAPFTTPRNQRIAAFRPCGQCGGPRW